MHDAEHSKLMLWDTQRDGIGRVMGAGFRVALAPGMGSSGLNSKGLSMKAAMTQAAAWPKGLVASSV